MKPVEKRKATGKLAELIEEFNDLPCEEKIRRISEARVKMEKEVWVEKAYKYWLDKAKEAEGEIGYYILSCLDDFRKGE